MEEALSNPRLFVTEEQAVQVDDFESSGLILDIGGGGEGIIGRLKGNRVIAIDILREELEEAPKGPLKLVMDACSMTFLDASFETVTAFFALMFIKPDALETAFRETFRVLKPGGLFRIWDAVIPPRGDRTQEAFVVRLAISMPNGQVKTGFGTRWAGREQNLSIFERTAKKAGFEVLNCQESGLSFSMVLQRPA